jgi:hypothetical protein
VVEEQVDPWARHERDETLEHLHRGEHQVRRPVGPRALERNRDPAVDQLA